MMWKCQNMFVYLTQFPPRHTIAWRHRTRNPVSKSARAPSSWEEFWVRDHKLVQGHLRVCSFLLHIHNWLQAQNRVQNVWSEKTKEEEARGADSRDLMRKRSADFPEYREHKWEGRKKKVCCHQTPAHNQKIPFGDSRQTLCSFTWCIKCWIS